MGGSAVQSAPNKKITLYGNIIDGPSRQIMCILDKCQIDYTLNKIEHLTSPPDNLSSGYKNTNPAGDIPMISEGSYKLMGGDLQVLFYIVNSKAQIKDLLFPNNDVKIKSMIGWYNAKMTSPGK